MSKREKGGYLGGHTVLTQSRSSYEAEMARAAERAKRRAKLAQERYDAEKQQKLKRKLRQFAKSASRQSPPVMPTMTPKELKTRCSTHQCGPTAMLTSISAWPNIRSCSDDAAYLVRHMPPACATASPQKATYHSPPAAGCTHR